jgi:hypothetical protein
VYRLVLVVGVNPRHADHDGASDACPFASIRFKRPHMLDFPDILPRTETHRYIRIRISNPQSDP